MTLSKDVANKCLLAAYLFAAAATFFSFIALFFHLDPHYQQRPYYQDFDVFYDVSKLIGTGTGPTVYNESTLGLNLSLTGPETHYSGGSFLSMPQHLSNPFVNPPPFMLLIYPLAFLSRHMALVTWIACGIAAWWTAFHLRGVKRNFPQLLEQRWFTGFYSILLLCSAYVYLPIQSGQLDLFTAAMTIILLCYRNLRPTLAGVMLGLLCIKPQLALLLPLLLLLEKNFRALLVALLTVIILCTLTLCFGPYIWLDWFHQLGLYNTVIEADVFHTAKGTISFYQRLRSLGVPIKTALTLHIGIAVLLVTLVVAQHKRMKDEGARIAVWLILTLMLSHYMLMYNLASVALAAFIIADRCLIKPSKSGLILAMLFTLLPLLPVFTVPFVLLAGLVHLLYIGTHEQPAITASGTDTPAGAI